MAAFRPKHRNAAAHLIRRVQPQFNNGHPRLRSSIAEYSSPGVHHEAVSIAFAATLMEAALRRSNDKSAFFYGSSPHKHFPMSFPGRTGESGRHAEQDCS